MAVRPYQMRRVGKQNMHWQNAQQLILTSLQPAHLFEHLVNLVVHLVHLVVHLAHLVEQLLR